MNITRRLFLFFIAVMHAGCVTTHYGKGVDSVARDFHVSCGRNYVVMHHQVVALTCSIENISDDWMTVKVKSVKMIYSASLEARVLEPTEVNDFLMAYRFEMEKSAANTQAVLAGLTIVGSAVAIAGGKSSGAGAAAAAGALSVSAGESFSDSINRTQYGPLHSMEQPSVGFGREHILGDAFKLPSRLFVRKSFLINVKPANTLPTGVEICFESPRDECLAVAVSYLRDK